MKEVNKNLHIAIITRGRIDKQRTLNSLHPNLLKYVTLYCHPGELEEHKKRWGNKLKDIIECPRDAKNIGEIREWVAWNSLNGKVIFADDDLKFCVRKPEYKSPKTMILKNYTLEEILEYQSDMFNWMWDTLDEPNVAVVGIPQRQFNWADMPMKEMNKRFYSFWGMNTKKYLNPKNKLHMCDWPIKEDFIVGIGMRKLGYDISINNGYSWDSWQSNSKGGCSNYRTIQMQNEIAKKMVALWPEFVTLKKRNNKNWGGEFEGQESLDVIIHWNKIK